MQLLCYLRTAQAKKSKFGNVMPVVVVFCNLFCIHFLHKYSFRKVKYLMLRKSDAAKLRVTLLSGNTVTVSENLSGSSRSCVFTASHGGSSATATITQEGSPVSYYFSYADGGTSHSERVESSSGSFILDITSYKKTGNSTKALSWSASGDSWIHVNGSSVSYEENPAKEIRSGNVTLTQEESNMKLTLTVRQKGKTSIDIEQ